MNALRLRMTAQILKAMAHPIRLQILHILAGGERCVCDILPALDSEQSNTSQHLTILKTQGIVSSRKEGSRVIYALRSPEVTEIVRLSESILRRQLEETHQHLTGLEIGGI